MTTLLLGLTAMLGASAAAPLTADVAAFLDLPVHRFVLDNGLTVAVHVDARAPLVATWVQIGVGSGDERPGQTGVAHLLEHLMYEGSRSAPNGTYDRLLAAVGGDNNAWTDHDATAFHAVVPKEALDQLLFLEADRLGWLMEGIDQNQLDNQLAVVDAEAQVEATAPHGRDMAALLSAVFGPGHPYSRPVFGSGDDRAALSLDDVAAFHRRWYTAANTTLVVAGDVEPGDVEVLVRRHFSALPGLPGDASTPPALRAAPTGHDRLFLGPVERPTAYLAWTTAARGHPDHPALQLLARVASDDQGSPLHAELVGAGVAQSARAWTWSGDQGGIFVVQVAGDGVVADRRDGVADAVVAALGQAVTDSSRVSRAQRRTLAGEVRGAEDLVARAELLADCLHRRGRVDCAAAELGAVLAATTDDLARVRASYLEDQEPVILLVLPEGGDRAGAATAQPVSLP